MRLKTFSAPSMAEAMRLVRQALGNDAIIVSTHGDDGSGSARVTAAVEPRDEDLPAAGLLGDGEPDALDVICEALHWHGVPGPLAERLIEAAMPHAANPPMLALAGALDAVLTFAPLPIRPLPRPLMLVGPAGVGKTVSIAKLAARAVLANQPVSVMTTDTVRAGAIDQLERLTRALRLKLVTAADPSALAAAVAATSGERLVLIDSPGANPFDAADMAELGALAAAATAEPVLVAAAGLDPLEAAEIGEPFAALGARRVLTTRLDAARRLGGLLVPAAAHGLSLSEVGVTRHIAKGLDPLNPVALARVLLRHAALEALAQDDDLQLFAEQAVRV
jgi:flagellar biosynthesis protein FlhF